MLSSTGIKPSTSASGSQPSGNTKKDKIQQTPSSTQKNKVEAHPKTVKSSFKNKKCVIEPKGTANVQHSKLNADSELICVKPTGQTFTIVGNAFPLTRITKTTEVPLRKPTALETDTPKHVVTLVYSRKLRKSKTNVLVNKPKIIKSISANNKEPSKSWGSIVFDVPSSSLDECRSSKLFSGTVKFGNDHVENIIGYGDYHIRNVTGSRVYYVEGVGHNLLFVGQFCDSNLEVGFRQHTCFIRNLEGLKDLVLAMALTSISSELQIIETIHVDFDKLTVVASEHSSLEPTLHEMTPTTISSGLVPNTPPSTTFVPPSRTDSDILFQPLFDELLNPPPSIDPPAPEVIAPNAATVALALAESIGSPSSTTVDQDAPSPSNSETSPGTQSHVISINVEEENHDLDVAHMNNDPFFGIPIPENDSESSTSD
ncbi:hypothetical protein Tco_1349038, partial [Tanacetum coccineum]